jgi:hypothetical protein
MAHTVQPMDEEEELELESIFLNSFLYFWLLGRVVYNFD